MDFLKLKITNFLAIGDAPELSLKDKGLVLIQGQNEDDTSANSNGVGKSSIVDALCWVLYGETARGVSGDSVVNKVAKKNCVVTITVQDGASLYVITRYRKHKEFKNQTIVKTTSDTSTTWADISKGTEKETQELINQIMGCSLDVFMAAIYAGQEVTPDLPKMTDKQLKMLIEEAAGVERLEAAYEIARKKMRSAEDLFAVATTRLETFVKRDAENQRDLEAAQLNAEVFDTGRPARAKEFEDGAVAAKKELVSVLTKMKGIDLPALEKRSGELAAALAGHSKLLKERDTLAVSLASAQREMDGATVRLEATLKSVKATKDRHDNAEVEIKKPCTECGKPGDEHDLEEFRAHMKKRLSELATDAKEKKDQRMTYVEKVNSCAKALEAFEATIPDTSEISAEQTGIATTIREYNTLKASAQSWKSSFDKQSEKANIAKTETNPHQATIDALTERIRKTASEIEECKKAVALAENDVAMREAVVGVFSPAGVRAHILDTVTPFLNDRTSDYLSALSDGNISAVWTTLSTTSKGDLKEKFNIDVSNDKGAESFMGLSGGEKRKVRLATMLALQDLVSSRATKPINIWIGDEIDDALDRSGLERLMGILERKARERGTVIVVSHSDLRDWIDQIVTVTKREGISTIDGALC